jgi:soluble lytic murein transglycosylase-like protein
VIQRALFRRSVTVALFVLAGQFAALGAEIAVLRNGFSMRYERREQRGEITRLYTADGYIDVPTEQIASFEADETPPPQQHPPKAQQPLQNALQTLQLPAATADVDQLVREASARRQLDPDFVNSVIKAESNFYPRAVSAKGAQGLMQLMPQTAAKLGVSNAFDPKANVEAGTTYLSELLDLYDNDAIKALAAYNAGPERVQQYHGVPPYRETKLYIARVVRDFNAKKAKESGQRTAPVPRKQDRRALRTHVARSSGQPAGPRTKPAHVGAARRRSTGKEQPRPTS